jgi:lipopolysaccharide export LptBFGC system permease protein LptF
MSIEECIRSICILAVIFGTIIYILLLWILSVLMDIRKELRAKKNENNQSRKESR